MSIEQNLVFLAISFAATGVGIAARSGVIRALGRKAQFHDDIGITAAGQSLRSAIANIGPTDLGQGRTEVRPDRNKRLVLPVCVMCILATLNIAPLLETFGIYNNLVHQVVFFGLCAIFWIGWFSILCIHRITWDRKTITYYSRDMRQHVRGLADLVDIRKRDGHRAIVLKFRGQPPLALPAYLPHRNTFLAIMQEIADNNTNNGMVPSIFGRRAHSAA